MSVFIAFLRGINVGGKNKINMTDLKRELEAIGLVNVETYIQSGNIIFQSDENENYLLQIIEHTVQSNFGVSTSAILRSADELEQIIQNCPFSLEDLGKAKELNNKGESFYVSFLPNSPSKERIEYLDSLKNEDENYIIIDRDIYLLLNISIRNSELANNLQKIDVKVTTRNFKTVNSVYSIVKSNYAGEVK